MSQNRALIVIDVQNEYITGNLRIEYPDVSQSLDNIGRAMDAAHAAGIPIVVAQHLAPESSPLFARGSQGAELHPTVAERPYDHRIEKSLASVLAKSNVAEWLRDRQVDTLTVIGYMTHNCDVSTAIQAHHEGWKVELLHDASGSVPYSNAAGTASAEEIHRAFTVVMNTGFAAVVSTDQWLEAVRDGQSLTPDNIYQSNQVALRGK